MKNVETCGAEKEEDWLEIEDLNTLILKLTICI